jgi:DNA invertase Pin-like site-specific DNA recombinase
MIFGQDESLRENETAVNKKLGNTGLCARRGRREASKNETLIKDHLWPNPMSRRIGYIRVSTRAQITDRQTKALESECDALRIEYVSAVAGERPVFEAALAELVRGDTFVVLDLDRAFRSSIDAMLTADALRERGVKMRILSLPIDTATAEGELFYTMVAAFANFERRIISRRTKEGLEAARLRGVVLGRPRLLTSAQVNDAYVAFHNGEASCAELAASLSVSRQTLQRGFTRKDLSGHP